jgi:3'(2'), 5'-bisphosphate nucleotidase
METLLNLARKTASMTAEIVMSYYGDTTFTRKEDHSPLTEADTRAHDVIVQALAESGIPILSEEGILAVLPYPPQLWVIDPIDGTTGFINGSGDFAVMIGLLEAGSPVLGVVHLPAQNTQYYAMKGAGAFMVKDGVTTQLHVSDRVSPNLKAVGSRNHAAAYMRGVAEILGVTEDVRIGGIGVKCGAVADKRADYFLTLGNLGEWDVCAPHRIIEEAGGIVSDKDGEPLVYSNKDARFRNGVEFSNGACHREVIDALRETLKVSPLG